MDLKLALFIFHQTKISILQIDEEGPKLKIFKKNQFTDLELYFENERDLVNQVEYKLIKDHNYENYILGQLQNGF